MVSVDLKLILKDIAFMPNNPHCTIGGGGLIQIDKFKEVIHNMHKSIKFTDSNGKNKIFTKEH